jgi:hypothetical protein
MYWWNVRQLAQELRAGQVDEKERFKYFLATSIAWTLVAQPFFYYGETFKVADVVSGVLALTITVIGTVLCYRVNKRGDNTDFIARMICLSWPIGIKLVMLGFGVLILVDIGTWATGSDFDVDNVLTGGLGSGITAALFGSGYYWLVYKYLILITKAKKAGNVY